MFEIPLSSVERLRDEREENKKNRRRRRRRRRRRPTRFSFSLSLSLSLSNTTTQGDIGFLFVSKVITMTGDKRSFEKDTKEFKDSLI